MLCPPNETATDLFMRNSTVAVVDGHPCWLRRRSAVPLCFWMSTCLSVARPLWACLPACGHLFTSSSISRHGCNSPPPLSSSTTAPPRAVRPSPPFSRVSPDTSCEPLMLIPPAAHLMQLGPKEASMDTDHKRFIQICTLRSASCRSKR